MGQASASPLRAGSGWRDVVLASETADVGAGERREPFDFGRCDVCLECRDDGIDQRLPRCLVFGLGVSVVGRRCL